MADDKEKKPPVASATAFDERLKRLEAEMFREHGGEQLAVIDQGDKGELDDEEGVIGVALEGRVAMIQEIGPNLARTREEEARQHADAEKEKARKDADAREEEARQKADSDQEKSRQQTTAKNHSETQKTVRLAIAGAVALVILFFSGFLLWLAKENGWPSAAYYVIAGLTALSLGGSGIVAARQLKPEDKGEK